MGNYMTKLLPPHPNETEKENNQVQTTERQADAKDDTICTPISERQTIPDPRSASTGIVRTPIEIRYSGSDDQSTPVLVAHKIASAIPRYLQTKQYLETDMDTVMPPFTPKKHCISKLSDSGQSSDSDGTQDCKTPHIDDKKCPKALTPIDKERYTVLGIDPRSPAADFNRTPILVPKSLAKLKARSQEHLTRRGSFDTDIYDPKNSCQDIRTINSPENRFLTDIATKYSKILSLKKSEEPNVSNTIQSDSDATTVSEGEAEVTVIKNLKFKNTEETLVSSDQKIGIDKQENNVDDQEDSENIEHDIATMYVSEDISSLCKQSNDQKDYSDKIKVWQDPLSLEENGSSTKEKENVKLPQQREDVIITFDEDVTLSKSGKVEEYQKKEMRGKKKTDSKINAKLDSNEEKLFNPSNKYGTETIKNRMPLSNRSNKDQTYRIATNSPQQLFKNKTLSNKEQENTPPCQKYGANTRSDIQWDSNSTIFI